MQVEQFLNELFTRVPAPMRRAHSLENFPELLSQLSDAELQQLYNAGVWASQQLPAVEPQGALEMYHADEALAQAFMMVEAEAERRGIVLEGSSSGVGVNTLIGGAIVAGLAVLTIYHWMK